MERSTSSKPDPQTAGLAPLPRILLSECAPAVSASTSAHSRVASAASRASSPERARTVPAKVANHRDTHLRRGAFFGHRQRSRYQAGNVRLTPTQPAGCIGSRLSDPTELGQQRVTAFGSEQPGERHRPFGVRLTKVLEGGNRKHAIDEVLGATSCLHPSCVRVPGSVAQELVREDRRAATGDSRIGFPAHTRGIGFRKQR